MGLGFTMSLTFLGSIREILGNGTWFGMAVMPESFEPLRIMVQAPGAFICLGLILAGMNMLNFRQARRKGEQAEALAQQQGCGSCGGCTACGAGARDAQAQ